MMEDILNDYIPKYDYASVGRRWLGALIDYILYSVVYTLVLYLVGGSLDKDSSGAEFLLVMLVTLFSTVATWFFFRPVIETLNKGQSIGKAIVGVRVVKRNGEIPGFGLILVRNLFDMVDYLPFFGLAGVIVAVNTEHKQRVGDLIAGTVVINAR